MQQGYASKKCIENTQKTQAIMARYLPLSAMRDVCNARQMYRHSQHLAKSLSLSRNTSVLPTLKLCL